MKSLKFKPNLAEMILNGEKTTTWRLADEKNLEEGDMLEFLNSETKEPFARGRITSASVKKMKQLTREDWEGHETFKSEEEMYLTYSSYYGISATPDTEIKVIKFTLE